MTTKQSKARIVERTAPNGDKTYVIQQRHFLFRWWWVDGWINSMSGAACNDTFHTLENAQAHLCYFDGTHVKDRVINSIPVRTDGDIKDALLCAREALTLWSDARLSQKGREAIDKINAVL